MKYYAHTIDGKPKDGWHLLSAHLQDVAEIMASFACKDEYSQVFRIAGYLHDLGKYQFRFQDYLKNGGRRGSVPHASMGASLSLLMKNQEISFAVDGHHKGLPDRADWKNDVSRHIKDAEVPFRHTIEEFYNDTGLSERDITVNSPDFKDRHEREFFTRYLFSALTDADWLDTERHYNPELSDKRGHTFLEYDGLIRKLESEIKNKSKDGELNNLRNKARAFVLAKAELPVGFYSMNLPTGMGKTLTSVSWALRHAKFNSLKRIIIVLPFVNIIDQTAGILKDIFGDDYVLEHHSGINEDLNISESLTENQYSRRLACENWDYPIIVTTTVQFFESIFNHKPSKCRKVHNISESVVIFDEVQSLPKYITVPTLTMLKNMRSVMNTSFLFCTATLPAFETRERFNGIETIIKLVENPSELFDKTRRVTYYPINNLEAVDYVDIATTANDQNSSVLAVFNTKKAARNFFDQFSNCNSWEKCYHLSTGMCPAHRKQVIKDIRNDLFANRKILVSSTQLIEAGVDFDFPCVFREIAPLESIIQSAGRCNRENKMADYGKVFLFRLIDSGMPDKQYRTASEFSMELIKNNPDNLYRHDFYEEYYRKFVSLFVDADRLNINKARENFDFETVSNSYRIIEKTGMGLFVFNYDDSSRELLEITRCKKHLSRNDYRRMQDYIVQVYDSFIINNESNIGKTDNGILVWYGEYDYNTGIKVDPLLSDKYVI